MRLTRLYVRFFRSFNFDYERKADRKAEPKDWEMVGDAWFPFVRIDIDPVVTAVVGANESGKSHLIDAIHRALTGQEIDRSDFCRYSSLFSVETGSVRVPDFGIEIELESDEDVAVISGLPIVGSQRETITLLRLGGGENRLIDASGSAHTLKANELEQLETRLPAPFELATGVALPDSITFDSLLSREAGPLTKRGRRFQLIELLGDLPDKTPEAVTGSVPQIAALLHEDVLPDARVDLTGRRNT